MESFRVVICGGGVAAIEGLLRLRRLLGDRVDIDLVAPNEDFAYRALAVKEPFAMGSAERFELRRIAADNAARWVQESLGWVDPGEQVVHTEEGSELPYDALLLAIGGRAHPGLDHVLTFSDADAEGTFAGLVRDVEMGYAKSVAFIAPVAPVWPLPLYELALMTAERGRGMGMDDLELSVITAESAPMGAFGQAAAQAVTRLLSDAGIDLYASALAHVTEDRELFIQPQGIERHPDRMIAMPRVTGPGLRGIPGGGAQGFIPIDRHCRVVQAPKVFAAGDATAFPVKHGGLGAQQADTAAAGIAHLVDSSIEAKPWIPVIRGMLLTGSHPLYLKAGVVGGQGFDSEVSDEPLWEPVEKVAAEELNAYLAGRSAPA